MKEEHGNAAIYGGSYGWGSAGRFHHPNGLLRRFLSFHGGFTASVNSYSCAAMEVILPHVIGGASNAIYSSAPHWDEISEHTDLIVASAPPLRDWRRRPEHRPRWLRRKETIAGGEHAGVPATTGPTM